MNILLTGVTGQLGGELLPLLSPRGQVTCIGRNMPSAGEGDWLETDLGDGNALQSVLNALQPELIVNAAAYTAVDLAETETDAAYLINEKMPEYLAHWSFQNKASLLHYSTDYVFDGQAKHPYAETDATNPQSIYAQSKLAGEVAITGSGCTHAIIRTAWVYSSHGKNFVLSMLNLAQRLPQLKIVADQVGCPTSAQNLALITDQIIEKWQSSNVLKACGIYHYRDDGVMSWYDFANKIFSLAVNAGLLKDAPAVTAIPGVEYPQAAKRPDFSVLDCRKINRDFGIQPYSFEDALKAVIDELSTAELP